MWNWPDNRSTKETDQKYMDAAHFKIDFSGYTGSKNQVWSRLKIQYVELDFSKLIFQKSSIDRQGVYKPKYFFKFQMPLSNSNYAAF